MMNFMGVPVIVDPWIEKDSMVFIDMEGVLPRPQIRTDKVQTVIDILEKYKDLKDAEFLRQCGVIRNIKVEE